MSQLELLFGRVELVPVVVDLSPAQSRWMGRDAPAHPGCPGCLLFGCCALHDFNEPRKD